VPPDLRRLPCSLIEVDADAVSGHLGDLHYAYCAAMDGPPWREANRQSHDFLLRFAAHALLPGFRCVLAHDNTSGRVLGFAYGVVTRNPCHEPSVAPVVEVLGADFGAQYLVGAFQSEAPNGHTISWFSIVVGSKLRACRIKCST
jgi:hypothetical protein